MMVTTHAFAGLLLAAPLALIYPGYAIEIAIAGLAGGVFPDLDILARHRKTLHYPVLYWVPLAAVGLAFVGTSAPWLLYLSVGCLGAAVHSVSDVFGGGLEKRPWEQTTDRAVFCHVTETWWSPRHYIAYDGSKGDFVATVLLAGGAFAVYGSDQVLTPLLISGLLIAGGYTLIRRWLPTLEDWLYEHVPILHPFLNGLH